MKRTQKVVEVVERRLAEQDMPVRAGLQVVKQNDPHCGLTQDQYDEWAEFVSWHLKQDFVLLLLAPDPKKGGGFFVGDYGAVDEEYGAFNTHDFERLRPRRNMELVRQQARLKRVEELALLYSCLSWQGGRENTEARFRAFLEREFGERLEWLARKLHDPYGRQDEEEMRQGIEKVRRQIGECEVAWAKHARVP